MLLYDNENFRIEAVIKVKGRSCKKTVFLYILQTFGVHEITCF